RSRCPPVGKIAEATGPPAQPPLSARVCYLPTDAQTARTAPPVGTIRDKLTALTGGMRTRWRRRATKIEDAINDHSATDLCARRRERIDDHISSAGAALALAARRRDRTGQHARAGH